jgi:hypothetical protein
MYKQRFVQVSHVEGVQVVIFVSEDEVERLARIPCDLVRIHS